MDEGGGGPEDGERSSGGWRCAGECWSRGRSLGRLEMGARALAARHGRRPHPALTWMGGRGKVGRPTDFRKKSLGAS